MNRVVSKNTKLIGIVFVILTVVLSLVNECPTNVQYFGIYVLVGIGISLLFASSIEKASLKLPINGMVLTIGGGASLCVFFIFTNPIEKFKPDHCSLQMMTTNTTVFVHGKRGKQDMMLRQKGSVIMDLKGERKRASINENGQAFFQNLLSGDQVQLEVDFSEPFKAIYPDSIYTIQLNGSIYLQISLQGIEKVQGNVLYNDKPLEGVSVKIDTLLSKTDTTGYFIIHVPEELQRQEYKVIFNKPGFKTISVPAFPQTGQLLEVVMDR